MEVGGKRERERLRLRRQEVGGWKREAKGKVEVEGSKGLRLEVRGKRQRERLRARGWRLEARWCCGPPQGAG